MISGLEIEDILNNMDNDIESIPVVCIPSYNRFDSATTIDLVGKSDIRCKVFIYGDQYDKYKHYEDKYQNVELVICKCSRGLRYKRNFILEYMTSNGYKDLFMLDDDIYNFNYSKWGKTKGGNDRVNSYELEANKFFAAWAHINSLIREDLEEEGREFAQSGITFTSFAFSCDYRKGLYNRIGSLGNAVYIDLEVVNKYNLSYSEDKTWEDQDFCLYSYEKGLFTPKIGILSMNIGVSGDEKSVCVDNDIAKEYSYNLAKKWGRVVKVKYDKKGQIVCRLSVKLKKLVNEKKFKAEPSEEYNNELKQKFNI